MRKAIKNVISFAVVLIIGTIGVSAYADPFGGAVVAGMEAMGVGIGVTGSTAGFGTFISGPTSSDPLGDWTDSLGDYQLYYKSDAYTVVEEGQPVSYDLVWFSQDFATKIQTEGIAFINNYGITDNSSGTLMSGTGHLDGIPVFYNSNPPVVAQTYTTQFYFIPALGDYNIGNAVVHATSGYSGWKMSVTWSNGTTVTDSSYNGRNGFYVFTSGQSFPTTLRSYTSPTYGSYYASCRCPDALIDNNPFSFDYVSAIVDLTPTDKGLKLFVKSGNIQNVLDGWYDYSDSTQHQDMLTVVSGITEGAGHDEIIDAEWTDDYNPPAPPVPPTPIPSTPLGEVPFDDWIDLWGQGIYEQLENQSDALDFIGSNGTDAIEELESIDQNIGALEETAESIDTNIGIGNGILGGIRSLAQSAVNYLEGIAEHVGELVEEIVEGTETLIAGILNQIPQAFGVIFGPIKQASSIWHYVVEWITSIGAPFQFIWSMASGTSYYVILPVYASLAAAVVLAFFKRFGR